MAAGNLPPGCHRPELRVHMPPLNTLHAAAEIRCSQIHTYMFFKKEVVAAGGPSRLSCELSDSSEPVVFLDKHILYQEFRELNVNSYQSKIVGF